MEHDLTRVCYNQWWKIVKDAEEGEGASIRHLLSFIENHHDDAQVKNRAHTARQTLVIDESGWRLKTGHEDLVHVSAIADDLLL